MKTKYIFSMLIVSYSFLVQAQNVGINTTGATPHPSAMLDVSSTDKGFLPPRMTSAERMALPTPLPANGLVVFDTNTQSLWIIQNGVWVNQAAGSGPWNVSGTDISNGNTGNVGIGTPNPTKKLEINSGIPNQSGMRISQYTSGASGVSNTDVFASVPSPTGVAFDNAGNCYATNFNDNKIHKISTTGVVTDFATTGLSGPHDIIYGPDGNLYVSNYSDGTVSKITLAGVVTIFQSGFSGPVGLAFDSGGYLFVVNNATGEVSKVDPTGVFVTHGFGSGLSSPYSCVFSPTNDKVYIANYGANEVAEINFLSGGPKTTFKSGVNFCTGINFDPNGDLLVAQAAPNKISKITLAGVMTDYATTTYPFDIIFNGGKLYVANQTVNTVSVVDQVSNFLAVNNAGEVVKVKADNLLQSTGQPLSNSWTATGNNISNNNTGNVSIGTTNSSDKLTVDGGAALFGTPIFYNNFFNEYDGGVLKIFNTGDGKSLKIDGSTIQAFNFTNFPFSSNSPSALFINPYGGKVNIGTSTTNSARVAIKRGTSASDNEGSLKLIGNTYSSYFHFGITEDTYIRGGKDGSHVILNDLGTGNVGIGTSTPSHKLSVNGSIRSQEVIVETDNWPDYVFADSYELPSLSSLEQYIQKHKHLPKIASAQEIEKNGQALGYTQKVMMEKIEELTLYIIALKKEIDLIKASKN